MDEKFNYANYLQEILGEKYIVTEELQFDFSKTKKIAVIVRQLSGKSDKISSTSPYELDIYTDKVKVALNELNSFANTYNKSVIQAQIEISNGVYMPIYISQNIPTPTVVQSDITMCNRHFSKIVMFPNLYIMKNVNTIIEISIDGESQSFINGSCGYQIVAHGTRVSGEMLSIQKKTEATTVLAFSFISADNIFCKKISAIRQGKLSGNTKFNVEIKRINGVIEEYTMIISSAQESFAEVGLTNINVQMVLAELPKKE